MPLPPILLIDSTQLKAYALLNDLTATLPGPKVAVGEVARSEGRSPGLASPVDADAGHSGRCVRPASRWCILLLVLPQNQIADKVVSFTLKADGSLVGATVNRLNLTVASTTLTLRNLTLERGLISANSATLALPNLLGGSDVALGAVTIDANGLHATANVGLPGFTLGVGGTGFGFSSPKLTIRTTGSGAFNSADYKLRLRGSLGLAINGWAGDISGTLWVDKDGKASGSLDDFELTAAGMSVEVSGAEIKRIGYTNNYMARVDYAYLEIPGQVGGYAEIADLQIRPAGVANPGLHIGSGGFGMNFDDGGATFELECSFEEEGSGYELYGRGQFKLAHIGEGTCGGLEIETRLWVDASNQLMMEFDTIQQEDPQWTALDSHGRRTRNIPVSATEPLFELREASITAYCNLPIDDTGAFLSEVSGTLNMTEDIYIELSATVTAGPTIPIIDQAAMSVIGTVTLQPYIPSVQDFYAAIEGVFKIFVFDFEKRYASISAGDSGTGFTAGGWVALAPPSAKWMKFGEGSVDVSAWTDYKKVYFTGSALLDIGWPVGSIWEGCTPYICCPDGDEYKVFNCWAWDTSECEMCISIPPWDMTLASAGVDVGKFTNGNWGFKGNACLNWGVQYCQGFYIDTEGNIDYGDVDSYTLVRSQPGARSIAGLGGAPGRPGIWPFRPRLRTSASMPPARRW